MNRFDQIDWITAMKDMIRLVEGIEFTMHFPRTTEKLRIKKEE